MHAQDRHSPYATPARRTTESRRFRQLLNAPPRVRHQRPNHTFDRVINPPPTMEEAIRGFSLSTNRAPSPRDRPSRARVRLSVWRDGQWVTDTRVRDLVYPDQPIVIADSDEENDRELANMQAPITQNPSDGEDSDSTVPPSPPSSSPPPGSLSREEDEEEEDIPRWVEMFADADPNQRIVYDSAPEDEDEDEDGEQDEDLVPLMCDEVLSDQEEEGSRQGSQERADERNPSSDDDADNASTQPPQEDAGEGKEEEDQMHCDDLSQVHSRQSLFVPASVIRSYPFTILGHSVYREHPGTPRKMFFEAKNVRTCKRERWFWDSLNLDQSLIVSCYMSMLDDNERLLLFVHGFDPMDVPVTRQ